MKYLRSRYYSALQLLKSYAYPTPFHVFIKSYFKQHKKYGSKDRKAISEICYHYFRCGLQMESLEISEGLLLSMLTLDLDNLSDWNNLVEELGYFDQIDEDHSNQRGEYIAKQIGNSVSFYRSDFLMDEFKHYNDSTNQNFRPKNWAKDHWSKEQGKLGLCGTKDIKLDMELSTQIQVQDLSSQYLCSQISIQENDKVWDVCCGSGGKSLNLSYDRKGDFYLTDIRSSILKNAQSRLQSLHYKASFSMLDATQAMTQLSFEGNDLIHHHFFDVIIADVPCSGSGTWFRNPEHFNYFDYDSIQEYSQRQKKIIQNSLPFLKEGGLFYYLTCSVFEQENTAIKRWMLDQFQLILQEEICFDGIHQKSDGMYMVCFRKQEK